MERWQEQKGLLIKLENGEMHCRLNEKLKRNDKFLLSEACL